MDSKLIKDNVKRTLKALQHALQTVLHNNKSMGDTTLYSGKGYTELSLKKPKGKITEKKMLLEISSLTKWFGIAMKLLEKVQGCVFNDSPDPLVPDLQNVTNLIRSQYEYVETLLDLQKISQEGKKCAEVQNCFENSNSDERGRAMIIVRQIHCSVEQLTKYFSLPANKQKDIFKTKCCSKCKSLNEKKKCKTLNISGKKSQTKKGTKKSSKPQKNKRS